MGTNAWSVEQPEEVKAKLVTTGVYTFYRDEFGENVGTPEDPLTKGYNITAGEGPQFLQNCLNACDNEVSEVPWHHGLAVKQTATTHSFAVWLGAQLRHY